MAAPKPAAPPKPSEQRFRQSLDGLSKTLGERSALHPDPVAEAAARRTFVLAQIRAEDQRLKLVLGIAGVAVAAVCVAAAIVFIAAPFGSHSAAPAIEAKTQPLKAAPPPPPPVQTTAVTPPPAALPSPPPPVQAAAIEPAPATMPQPAAPPTAAPPTVAPPTVAPSPVAPPPPEPPARLAREDIKEIQGRLVSFGFNAGPADGNAGRMTEGAIMNYQQMRGLPQTGKPDRVLLDQLRDDPAPKVAVAAPRTPPPPPPASPYVQRQRRSDGLDFVRDADARLSHWFQSLSN